MVPQSAAHEIALEEQKRLVQSLESADRYPHPVVRISVIETHISFVILTGTYAYKLKKPLDLGFLDFTTLEKRRYYCEEEMRLNSRLAPRIYLEVVAICGSVDNPRFDADSEAIEYAVKMHEFSQEGLLDSVLANDELAPRHIDDLAMSVADFHSRIGRATTADAYGAPQAIREPMQQNFSQLHALLDSTDAHRNLEALEEWSFRAYDRLVEVFSAREEKGFVRECHGDLHLGNIALVDGEIQIFDGIEFNPNLRWIDVMNEVAFLVMDLSERGRSDYASRFLNDYLEIGGDYSGLRVLPFYLVYRAIVRAKISRIRAAQAGLSSGERKKALAGYAAYIGYAAKVIVPRAPALLITHGLSGSGKTYLAQSVLEAVGAIRLRSDVERKRLHELPQLAHSGSDVGAGLYDEASTRSTYERLVQLAETVIKAGFTVIIDAAFLQGWQRDLARMAARRLAAPFLILDCQAPESVLQERIASRGHTGHDASEATLSVLKHQLSTQQPLNDEETACAESIDSSTSEPSRIVEAVRRRIEV